MPGNDWWVTSFPAAVPGSAVQGGGGYGTDVLTYRNPLDAARSAAGVAPGSSYPDGYLGTITGRRQDRLTSDTTGRLTERNYLRGVHKGDIVGRDAYYWTADVNPGAGIERQALAVPADVEGGLVQLAPRAAPSGEPTEILAHGGKTAMMDDPADLADPARAARMSRMLPPWSSVNGGM